MTDKAAQVDMCITPNHKYTVRISSSSSSSLTVQFSMLAGVGQLYVKWQDEEPCQVPLSVLAWFLQLDALITLQSILSAFYMTPALERTLFTWYKAWEFSLIQNNEAMNFRKYFGNSYEICNSQ